MLQYFFERMCKQLENRSRRRRHKLALALYLRKDLIR